MPTLAEVQAAIAVAVSAALAPSDMVAICDYCIASLATSGKPLHSYSIGGKEFQFDVAGWQNLRAYYQTLADRGTTGGYVPQQAEF